MEMTKIAAMKPELGGLAQLMHHWRGIIGDKAIPSRADLDPAELGSLLPNIMLVDVERSPFRFRMRLAGSALDEAFGRKYSGCYLDDAGANYFEAESIEDYARVVFYKRPHFTSGQAWSASDECWNYTRLLLPMSSNGVEVDMLLGGVYPTSVFASNENVAEYAIAI